MVISAVPKTQLTLSLSSSNLLISGHSAKAYSHSALDRLSRYRVRNKLTFKNSFHYFLYLNLRVGWWAIQILSIPNYSILQLPLASLSSYSQRACLQYSSTSTKFSTYNTRVLVLILVLVRPDCTAVRTGCITIL